jgi:hypothetical protein
VLHLELRIRELEALNASLNAKYDLFICVFNLFSESYRRIAYFHRLTGKKEEPAAATAAPLVSARQKQFQNIVMKSLKMSRKDKDAAEAEATAAGGVGPGNTVSSTSDDDAGVQHRLGPAAAKSMKQASARNLFGGERTPLYMDPEPLGFEPGAAAIAGILPAGTGFKELARDANHPHYHPGASHAHRKHHAHKEQPAEEPKRELTPEEFQHLNKFLEEQKIHQQRHQEKYDDCVNHHNTYLQSDEFKQMDDTNQQQYLAQFKQYQVNYHHHQQQYTLDPAAVLAHGGKLPLLHVPHVTSGMNSPHSDGMTPTRSGAGSGHMTPLREHHPLDHPHKHHGPHGLTPFQQHMQQLQQHPVAHHGHHPSHHHPAHGTVQASGHLASDVAANIAALGIGTGFGDAIVSHAVVHSLTELNALHPHLHHIVPDQSHAQHAHPHGYVPADIPFASKASHAGPHAHIPHVAHSIGPWPHHGASAHGTNAHGANAHAANPHGSLQKQQSMTVPQWGSLVQAAQAAQQPLAGQGPPTIGGKKGMGLRDVVLKLQKQAADGPNVPIHAQGPSSKMISTKKLASMKLDQMMTFAKVTPKMSQETTTDDLEAYIASQNAATNATSDKSDHSSGGTSSPHAGVVMLAQAGKGRSKMGELTKAGSIRIPGLLSTKSRNNSKRGLNSAGVDMGSNAVSPLAFETILEQPGPSDAAGELSDRKDVAAALLATPDKRSSQGQEKKDKDDVSLCSPLTVDETLQGSEMDNRMDPPSLAPVPPINNIISVTSTRSIKGDPAAAGAGVGGTDIDTQSLSSSAQSATTAAHSSQHRGTDSVDDNTVTQYAQFLDSALENDQNHTMRSRSRSPTCASPQLVPLVPLTHTQYTHAGRSKNKSGTNTRTNTPTPRGSSAIMDEYLTATGTSLLPSLNAGSTHEMVQAHVAHKLRNAPNPLQVLYDDFGHSLPDFHKSRLLVAIASINAHADDPNSSLNQFLQNSNHANNNAFRQAKKFFADICPLVHKLLNKAHLGITGADAVEKLFVSVCSLKSSLHAQQSYETNASSNTNFIMFEKSLESMYKKIGALEALKVFVEVQLGEYRAIFEGIGILSANTFPTLMNACSEFKECYDMFVKCQGIIVSLELLACVCVCTCVCARVYACVLDGCVYVCVCVCVSVYIEGLMLYAYSQVEVGGRIASVKDRCAMANLPSIKSLNPYHSQHSHHHHNHHNNHDDSSVGDEFSLIHTHRDDVSVLTQQSQQSQQSHQQRSVNVPNAGNSLASMTSAFVSAQANPDQPGSKVPSKEPTPRQQAQATGNTGANARAQAGPPQPQTAQQQQQQQQQPTTARQAAQQSSKGTPFATELRSKNAEIDALKTQVSDLTTQLETYQHKIEDLELELIQAHNDKDKTPGALIFYATMSDPFAVSCFKSLYDVLSTFQGFVNCVEHLDFPTVRKRLKQCLSQLPVVDRFVCRYDSLHKRWTQKRMGMYLDRGLGGSSADDAFICPICESDQRLDRSQGLLSASYVGAAPHRLGMNPSKVLKDGSTHHHHSSKHGKASNNTGQGSNGPSARRGTDISVNSTNSLSNSIASNLSLPPVVVTPSNALSVYSQQQQQQFQTKPPTPAVPIPVPVPLSNYYATTPGGSGTNTIIMPPISSSGKSRQASAMLDISDKDNNNQLNNNDSSRSLELFSPVRLIRPTAVNMAMMSQHSQQQQQQHASPQNYFIENSPMNNAAASMQDSPQSMMASQRLDNSSEMESVFVDPAIADVTAAMTDNLTPSPFYAR